MKYLELIDGTKIPINDNSPYSVIECFPNSMEQVEEWFSKLTPNTTKKIVELNNGAYTVSDSDENLTFFKIELEHASSGYLMRIHFATSLELEAQRLMIENEQLRKDSEAYHIIKNGGTYQ